METSPEAWVRCHCDACRHDVLVPFSCKQRGLCPSCGARRICDAAANITDRIFPNVPVRQGVISEERGNDVPDATPLDAFAALALAGGTFVGRPFAPREPPSGPPGEDLDRKGRRFSAKHNGFDVHCAVRLAAADDEGRERLLRSCARPPFALERIEEMNDGRIGYLMKTPRRGSTHRVMTPVEFLARLAILVPPPYFPLVRYHGVFAARSSWRALLTPKPPDGIARSRRLRPES